MKRLIILLSFLFAVPVLLGQFAVETFSNPGGINQVVTANTTNVYSACTIDVRKQENVAMLLSFKLVGAGTGNVTLTFTPTIEIATSPTAGAEFTWVVAATGATTATVVTNFATAGYGYFKLVSIGNAGGDTLTNIVLKYAVKKSN